MLFISHRLEEIFEICQRVTTLRDGAWIASEPLDGMTEDDLVRRMVGRDLDELYPKQDVEAGEVALSVRRLTREGVFTDVSFDVRRGEIVGLAGLVGAGPHARSPGPSSASTAGTPARSRWTARQLRPRRAHHRHGRRARPRPRGPARPGPGDGHVHRAQHRPDRPPYDRARPASMDRGAERSRSARLGGQAPGEVRPDRRHRRHAVRRQPAEGRPRQVAGHRPQGAHRRRADPRHRRRHQGRGAPAALASWPPTGSPS